MLSGHFSTALNSFPSPGKGESLFPRVLPPYCLSLVLLSPCPLLTREKLSSSKSLPVTLSWAMAPVLLVYILFYSAAFVFSVSAAWNGKATVLHLPFSHTPRGLRSSVGLGKVPWYCRFRIFYADPVHGMRKGEKGKVAEKRKRKRRGEGGERKRGGEGKG